MNQSKSINITCKECGHENRQEGKFCSSCGSKLKLICSSCGKENEFGDNYCSECGQSLANHNDNVTDTPDITATKSAKSKSSQTAKQLLGERRSVTVLFADAKGFTPISEKLNEEQVYNIMQEFIDLMVEVIKANGGTVTQFLGDGIMALFGAPIAHENSSVKAVSAALKMQSALEKHSLEVNERYSADCHFRIGLNTGPVVVGRINDNLDMDYTALGNTVNLAARMQQMAEPGTVYISNYTFKQVQNYFNCEALGALSVKGKSDPVEVFKVVSEKPIRSRIEVSSSIGLSPYVGREEELALLNNSLAKAEKSKGQLVNISGEAGIGKSRMLLEFRRKNEDRNYRWLQGSGMANGQNIPYLPIIDILKQNFNIKEGEGEDVINGLIDEKTKDWDSSVQHTIPYLKFLLNIDAVDDNIKTMDALERRANILEGIRALLLYESRLQPLVIFIEDLHWVDEQTEAAISMISDAIVAAPILLILTTRPKKDFFLRDKSHHHKISLDQLPASSCDQMMAGILQTSKIPAELKKLIIEKTEGNPFFIEEVLKSLKETEIIQNSSDGYEVLYPIDQIEIPDTIQDVILSRIDRLEKQAKEALQLASVIGREFTVRLLNRITDLESSLENLLEELNVLELIFQKEFFPELSYMFKHALTHDVAYYTLLKQRRKKLHRAIGLAIEELYSNRLAEHYEMLALHFYEGEDWTKALDYLLKSAQKASDAFTNHDAIQFYSKALSVCGKLGASHIKNSIEIHQLRGMSNFTIGDYPGAISDFQQMSHLAGKINDRHSEGIALAFKAWMEWWNHDIDKGDITAKAALKIAEEGFVDVEFFASSTLGVMYYGTNRVKEAIPFMVKANKLAPKVNDLLTKGWWSIVGWHQLQWESRFDDTINHLKQHRASIENTKMVFLILGDYWLDALPRASKGEYTRALELLFKVINTSNRVGGVPFWHTRTLNTIGWIYGELQDFEEAMKWNTEGIEQAVEAKFIDPEVEFNARLNLGDNFMELGMLKEAEEQFLIVEKVVKKPKPEQRLDLWRYSQHLFHSYGKLWLIKDDDKEAMEYANKCLKIAEQGESRKYIVKARRLRAQVHLKRRDIDSATQEISIVLDMAKKVGNPPQLWRTYITEGDILASSNNRDPAKQAYLNAKEIIEQVADSLSDSKLKESLLNSNHVKSLNQKLENLKLR